jgi:hypothetical protein
MSLANERIKRLETTLKTYDIRFPKLLENNYVLDDIECKIKQIETRKKELEYDVIYYRKMTHRADKLWLDYSMQLLDAEIKKLKYLEEEKGKLMVILEPHFIEPKNEVINTIELLRPLKFYSLEETIKINPKPKTP